MDVSETMKTERMAQESDLRLRGALNQSVGFIGILSPEGELIEINDPPLVLAGLQRENEIGKLFWETGWWAGKPEAQAQLKEEFRRALTDGPIRSECYYYLCDGTERIADRCLTASHGPDGEVAFVLAEGMDITERVKAEQGLRLLAEVGKTLSSTLIEEEMLTGLVSVLTRDFADLCFFDRLVGDQLQRVLWCCANQEIEERLRPLTRYRQSYPAEHVAVRTVERGRGVFQRILKKQWLLKSGATEEYANEILKVGIVSLISVPVRGRGRVQGCITFCQVEPTQHRYDETEFRVAEELAQRLGLALENARLYSEVAEARDDALRANSMKSQFLANMSHEIRTPMVGVQGMLELLAGTELSKEQREFVDTVRDCSTSLLTVLDDVLDLARIDAGKMVVHDRPFELATAIKGTLALFELQAQQRGLDLRVSLSAELPKELVGDPDRIRQLLVNLMSNAMKFTHDGFVELRVFPNQQTLRVEVEDTGIGIEPARLNGLWDAFEQVDNSSSRRYEGTGLGLNIVKRLVELMGGRVGAESTPDHGSTFWFELPLRIAEISESTLDIPQRIPEVGEATGGRILVAEDNPINRRVLVQQLGVLGYDVVEASSGREVLEMIDDKVELVLMDCQMPDLDGYGATRKLRAEGYRLPILALTAHAMSEERTRCLEAGMDDHLVKPLARDALAVALREWLARGRGRETA